MTTNRPGDCIEHIYDEFGLIEVYESIEALRLYFGNDIAQSEWLKYDPDWPSFTYYRALLAALAFKPDPANITVMGLGGGVLARFLLEHTNAKITVMELRPTLVELARTHFRVDTNHPRLRIILGDAQETITQLPPQQDVVMMDVFDQDGMVEFSAGFFSRLGDRLADDGILAANLWRTQLQAFAEQCERITATFEQTPLAAHLPERDNSVLLFSKQRLRDEHQQKAAAGLRELPDALRRAIEDVWPMLR